MLVSNPRVVAYTAVTILHRSSIDPYIISSVMDVLRWNKCMEPVKDMEAP